MIKKKWGFNSKVFSTITLVFVVCCLMATSSWAARKVEFYQANAGSFIEKLNQNESTESESIGPLLGLSQDEAFTLLRKKTDFNGVTHYRYQQTYKGIPVWGIQTVISRDPANQVARLHGSMVLDTPGDIKDIPSSLDPLGALKKMEDQHKKIDKNAQWTFRNEEYGTYVFIDEKNKAHLCFVVSFFADTEKGNPSQFIHFIDVKNGKVLDSFDMLRYQGTGPGGNQKVGQYYYGTDYPAFCVSVNDSTCTMNCTDIKTVDLNHGTSGTTAYSYPCYENTHEQINGAYCPLNDAQYFGQAVFDTYMDWYGLEVLPFQLTLRCHYSTNYENAFWDGSTMTFGDGYTTFYPLVALDIVANEVSHGFTEFNSGLIYSGQSGGINEAFSDMAGEACKYYMRGTNDFRVGYDIFKSPTGALRYMYDPPLDGISIDHVDDYYTGMDVHYSSGIFNKAFWLIATSPGWTTKMAFDIFVKANQDYWIPSSTFVQGAEGAQDAALDLGYPCGDVADAFQQVGIDLSCLVLPDYCKSSGVSQYYEYIAGVEVGDLNNPSGSSPYSDFTHLVANITGGETVNVELTPGFPDRKFTECWRIWIDYNGDYDFEDEGEQVFNGSGNDVVTGSFIVPCGTVYCTRMRVSMSYEESGCPTSCGTFPSGEVEDYAVNIIGSQAPVANFVGSPTSGCSPLVVHFTDQSTNNPTSWSWDFGDGGTSDEKDPVHTYTPFGTYTVTLTATNACGSDSETKTNYITVLPPPVADFETCVTNIRVGDSIKFTDKSTGNPTLWDWTFEGGDPATNNIPNPTVTYDTAGTYDVTLTVTNACGSAPETKTGYINVSDTAYCASWGDPSSIYIDSIEVADLNNPSGSSCYTDFTHLTAHLTRGKTFPVSLESYGGGGNHYWKIWIDYNGDYDFEDSGEEVFSGSGSSVVTGSFTVPCCTILGDTRMRVSMGTNFPPFCGDIVDGEVEDYIANIKATVGYTGVFSNTFINDYRYAQPIIMPEDGTIESVSMYHTGGSGKMILGVYDDYEGSPQNLLGVTAQTDVSGSTGWQTIPLESPTEVVTGGSTIWLAWVYEVDRNPGIRYQSGSPGAYQSPFVWGGGMPDPFGTGTHTGDIYSIYATYTTQGCTFGYRDVFPETSRNDIRRAQPFPMPEDGTIESISMYHEAGNGSDHMILAVYDDVEGSPYNLLGETAVTPVDESAGWQTIDLESPTEVVTGGSTVWLAWVYEQRPVRITTGIRYEIGIPGAVDGDSGWPSPLPPGFDPMPDIFRDSSQTDRNYSIYANYITIACQQQYTLTTNVVGNGTATLNPPGGTYVAGTVVTLTAVPDPCWQFSNWSGDLSGTENPTTITMDSNKSVTANFSAIGGCTEIAEAVDNGSLTFTRSGDADWYKVTDVYYYGGDSAKSGSITHNQSTTIETTVTVGSTQSVKFYWKVSSEANYDYLKFYIDGVEQARISGEVNWTQEACNISAGTHTLKWSYTKDAYVSSGSDCGWVDKLEITAPAADPIAEAVDYPSLTFTLSGNGNWFSQTTTTYYGGDAAQSADIANNQSTTMETTISGKTSVKFYWKVSSEANFDYLKFYIDGVEKARIAGTVNWTQKTYTVSSGTHTLKWSYTKDVSVSTGSDCGWVDKLELQ